MSAFAAAVGALFADPNIGRDAIYIADGGAPVLVRVVARRADAITDFGDARLWSERLVAAQFRSALAAQARVQTPWHISAEQTADPFGLLVALRGLAHVQLITLLAHPEHGRAIVGGSARHDQDELCRLLCQIDAL